MENKHTIRINIQIKNIENQLKETDLKMVERKHLESELERKLERLEYIIDYCNNIDQ
ncbi:hypothetical protein VAE308_180014 [Vibrio aestuarianus]|uniref:hypothetical protein n=1 Tax=Vibrio TaxID=662 RepID=UPI0002E392D3|nr:MULTISPECIES: hypothetical protein [Vibrio]CAK2142506.1 hypothetical protein VCRA2118O236_40261 [Vibrio crassostreae]NLS56556.1 hypothetical protein [Vibrio aestuarianus subsp. francensis]CAH8185228.1 hypothetical protein VAE142_10002 [Vibrio aestuarianus]CAH8231908.1 hypothetical protein VAE308_180014 [Vibrio aestuarianus]CAK3224979.1 hypothetical protein VCRA2128O309_240011 [Vibrio crassostreae]